MDYFSGEADDGQELFQHQLSLTNHASNTLPDYLFDANPSRHHNMFAEPQCLNASVWETQQDSLISNTPEPIITARSQPVNSCKEAHNPCRCTKIQCNKRYCQCFGSGRKCTPLCHCHSCHNQPTMRVLKVVNGDFWAVSNFSKKWRVQTLHD